MSISRVEGPFAIGDGPMILLLLQTSYWAERYICNLAPSPGIRFPQRRVMYRVM